MDFSLVSTEGARELSGVITLFSFWGRLLAKVIK
jgi:hypothetical protein